LTVSDSTITNNVAVVDGGGIFTNKGTLIDGGGNTIMDNTPDDIS
jgi:predicted outer membrane repeat protein